MYRKPNIYVNNELLDTFKDEVIQVTSTVKQLSDISKVFTDFSQSFNIPASPKNNRILKHYYDFNIKNPLDTRKKLPAYIQLDGIDFVNGFIRVENVKMQFANPISYEITFFGNLVNLTNLFKETLLSELDFSFFNHPYNASTVQFGRDTGVLNQDIIYPFISRYRRWFYNSDPNKNINDDDNLNIYFNPINFDEFKPAIKFDAIISQIESLYGIKLNGFIKSNPALANLYMWLNANDGEKVNGFSGFQTVNFSFGTDFTLNNNLAYNIYNLDQSEAEKIFTIRVIDVATNEVYQEVTNENGIFINAPNTPITVRIEVSSINTISVLSFLFEYTILGIEELSDQMDFVITVDVAKNFSELKVIDFISGIVKMFNLIITSEDGINFTFTPLQEWYNSGKIIDITDYVSFKEYDISKPTIYNQVNFKFEESSTVLAEQFNTLFGYRWGDSSYKVLDEDDNQVEGEAYDIELPFQQTVYERLIDLNTGEMTNLVWSEGLGLENHLFFAIQRGGEFNPSKLNAYFTFDPIFLSFNAENEEYTLAIRNRSLFYEYYQDYISDIFSIRRKEMNITCRLPNHLITTLKLNDRVVIDKIRFIIEEMDINLLTGVAEMKLLNDIF